MKSDELQSLIDNGEDTRVEYKRTFDFSVKAVRAELVRDIIAMANAHDKSAGYIIIGYDEDDGSFHDASGLKLDDGSLHSFFDEYIDAPVTFSFQYVDFSNVKLGLITLPYSNERFHMVKKDLQENGRTFLTRGDMWIRRGANRVRLTGHDMRRLKDEVAQQNALPQPRITVTFDTGKMEEINVADWYSENHPDISSHIYRGVTLPYIFLTPINNTEEQYPNGTMPIGFMIHNEGVILAEKIEVSIELPNGCKIYRDTKRSAKSNVSLSVAATRASARLPWKTFPSVGEEAVAIFGEHLIHGTTYLSDRIPITFPAADQTYEFRWTARAGNMIAMHSGILRILPESSGERSPLMDLLLGFNKTIGEKNQGNSSDSSGNDAE